ncbi:GH3 domain-containing protein [Rhinatrema bivittatum]|uniref:GH3 domain-containing protein n=1 Tax=Rhinatrema bivittatum TaxID=194408 RepID=UPI0011268ECA|nr:GH3 domain-containing protein [Rhinatrema bivittatum]XP_029429025.1 GH3 domain-containing protein [Rhinatrema bivittatum]XP_029429026.1 GH3 domain-containing protein [Rhinatrema bivittatum]XP_029429027.1 GH3 domain-containing protein [Rhinatrema bivittatum]XP_029429028.1 GH3 domain-containing protein [Rhinatrema bivittatum]
MLLLLLVSIVLGLLGAAGILFWKAVRDSSSGQKWCLGNLLGHYVALRMVGWQGFRQRQRLEADSKNIQLIQEGIILQQLQRSQDTEYGQQFCFKGITDSDTFRKRHPLTRSSYYSEYFQRIANGEENVLIPGRPTWLAVSSGTCAMVPVITVDSFLQGTTLCLNTIFSMYPGSQEMASLCFAFSQHQSDSGIPVLSSSLMPFAAAKYLRNLDSTPAAVLEITSEPEVLYACLIFALRDKMLGMLEAGTALRLSDAFAYLQNNWCMLAEDIEKGRLNPQLQLPDSTRRDLDALLRPDPGRAWELRAQFEKGFEGIARRVWPDLQVVLAVDSAYDELAGDSLREFYCKGVLVYSALYGTVEGLIGVNLWPEKQEQHYALCPRSMFWEFLPAELSEEDEQQLSTMCMQDVKENGLYELVISNGAGLYRYRTGDVVRVTGFYNQCPVLQPVFRQSQTLSVRGERISEEQFYHILQRALQLWPGARLIDYCCVESSVQGPLCTSSDPHYEVFLEIRGVRNLSEDQRYKLDQCLQEACPTYKSFRFKGSIGPVRVHLVQPQAFMQLRDYIRSSSGASQMARVLRRKEEADFIQRKVIS